MYLWTAIDVDEPLEKFREKVAWATQKAGIPNTALTLPLHISLRISFPLDDSLFMEAVSRISEYYQTLSSFYVEIQEIEQNGTVVWIKMKKNEELDRIHKDLVDLFLREYKVQPHAYDLAFCYHSTLWIGTDETKAKEVYAALQQEELPDRLTAKKFVIGCSESGKAGEFRVIREFITSN